MPEILVFLRGIHSSLHSCQHLWFKCLAKRQHRGCPKQKNTGIPDIMARIQHLLCGRLVGLFMKFANSASCPGRRIAKLDIAIACFWSIRGHAKCHNRAPLRRRIASQNHVGKCLVIRNMMVRWHHQQQGITRMLHHMMRRGKHRRRGVFALWLQQNSALTAAIA